MQMFSRLFVVVFIVFLLMARGTSGVVADDLTPVPLNTEESTLVNDPGRLRRVSNAPYVGIVGRYRITQRFEMYNPHSAEALRALRAMGFTQVILDWPNLHAEATAAGLKVVLSNWWTQETKPEDIQQGIQQAREVDANALIGFSVMDEPERNAPDTPFSYYIDLYEQLRPRFQKEFPGTRLEISHWGPLASWDERFYEYFSFLYEAADVMRIMPYPDLHEAPLDDVFFMIQRSRRLMQMANRDLPLTVILQTWILPPKNKLPEIAELRVMAYQAMLSGAETLSFFDYNPDVWAQTPGFERDFRELMGELVQLSRQHRDDTIETQMSADGILEAILRSPTGFARRIVVNTNRTASGEFKAFEIRATDDPLPSSEVVVQGCDARKNTCFGVVGHRFAAGTFHDAPTCDQCLVRCAGTCRPALVPVRSRCGRGLRKLFQR